MNLKPLIICPKSVITNWSNVMTVFGIDYYGLSNYDAGAGISASTSTSTSTSHN
jgi:hypothetical protein